MINKHKKTIALFLMWFFFVGLLPVGGIVPVAIGVLIAVYSLYLAFQQIGKAKLKRSIAVLSLSLLLF